MGRTIITYVVLFIFIILAQWVVHSTGEPFESEGALVMLVWKNSDKWQKTVFFVKQIY